MPGVKGLRKIQIGVEASSVPGTAVNATTVLRMNGMIADNREIVFPEEQVGYLGGLDRSYTPKLFAECEIEGEATFEQLPYILNAAIMTAAGVQDGAGTDYLYTYNLATTSVPTTSTYTIETGDNQEAEEMSYSHVSEFTLSGAAGEAWMVSSTWNGRTATVAAFSASCAVPTVETMLFGKTKLYIDNSTAAFGTTLKSNTLLAAELKMETGLTPVWAADGQTYFSFIKPVGDEVTLDLTFEHDATGAGEKVSWRAEAPKNIRLLIEGTSVATAGTTYTYKSCIIDLSGKWETLEKIDEIDGNDVIKGTFRAKYTTGASKRGTIIVVNELATLP